MVGSEQQIVDVVPVENHDVNIGAPMNNIMHLQKLRYCKYIDTFIQLLFDIIHITCIILIIIRHIILITGSFNEIFEFSVYIVKCFLTLIGLHLLSKIEK